MANFNLSDDTVRIINNKIRMRITGTNPEVAKAVLLEHLDIRYSNPQTTRKRENEAIKSYNAHPRAEFYCEYFHFVL